MGHRDVWIVSATRTPIGSFLGSLADRSAPELGSVVISEALARAKIEGKDVSEVMMGCVLTAAMGQAPARQAAIYADLPSSVPCTTIGKVCGSGLKAAMLGAQAIASGNAEVVVAGGMESMSNAPYALKHYRKGVKMGHQEMIDTMVHDGLWDVYNNFHMGSAGELCAKKYGFSREMQDAFAKQSYERALQAQENGSFEQEIVSVEIVNQKSGSTFVSMDEEPKKGNFDKFQSLRPVFSKDGTITAANASSINDGAAALVLVSDEELKKRNLKPLARICGHAQFAREPEWFTVAPAGAISKLLGQLSWNLADVDLFEINEAFAVVNLAVAKELSLDPSRVNVHGGAVSLGHPIGASGARILTTLIYALQKHGKKRGIASLCIGGGEAVAMGIECI
ncbi:MAG: acetyl-CoA C-acetyltransferase [Bdellovibrionales bacterium]|nr:acetyl-CoA C-acetyltransferase [Bdellovibrionales bacterium]